MRYPVKLLMAILLVAGVAPAQNEWDTVWTKTYGGNDVEDGWSLAIERDGNYVVVGRTLSYGSGRYDAWILKINPLTGDTIWTRVYGWSDWDEPRSVAVADGVYFLIVETDKRVIRSKVISVR